MQYCLAINTHGNQATYCDAVDHVMGSSPKLFCSRLKGTLNNYFFRPVDRISNIGEFVFGLFSPVPLKTLIPTDSCLLQIQNGAQQ